MLVWRCSEQLSENRLLMRHVLLEGPFESDYSLAIVNRRLAKSFLALNVSLRLYQRDNTTLYPPSDVFLADNPDLAPLFLDTLPSLPADVHSRNIYPPHTDRFAGTLRAIHCYGWEESGFPARYAEEFNRSLDLVTVTSGYVRDVLRANGVQLPVAVVGNGADHILESDPLPAADIDTSGFVFLHVSSCFPRKGPEVLVQAFCEEFTRRDDVRLIIKTLENPHNRIREIVQEASGRWPSHAPIEVVFRSFGLPELRWLYQQSGSLVSASRGEGFGLPVAEAMLVGCPVIATVYSGQADICTEGSCWPVEYRLEPARTHLTEGASYWAEPALASLRAQMRAVYEATGAERRRRTARAEEFVRRRYTWCQVAERHWAACCEVLENRPRQVRVLTPRRIGFVTSWNTRCGIAEYTRYLATSLPADCRPMIFASEASETVRPDENYVSRCWTPDDGVEGRGLDALIAAILNSGVEALSVQFNFGFFAPSRFQRLIETLRQHGIVTAVTLHGTQHDDLVRMRQALWGSDFCICHRREEVERIRTLGLARNPVWQRHGIPQPPSGRDALRASRRRGAGAFVVSCFGFFLPPKGIHELVYASALARRVSPLLQLSLINALYPNKESPEYAAHCLALIAGYELNGSVSLNTDFLDDRSILGELASTDLVVLPYTHSTESSSAAIRLPIASLTPVLCSDLGIFDEFGECVHRFPARDPVALANAILHLVRNPQELARFSARQAQVAAELAWPVIASQFAQMLLLRETAPVSG